VIFSYMNIMYFGHAHPHITLFFSLSSSIGPCSLPLLF
jgi:hypothetical protein